MSYEQHGGIFRESVGETTEKLQARQILLIGELNPYGDTGQYALYCDPPNSAGGRLQRAIFGVPEHVYLAMWRTNLCTGSWANGRAYLRIVEILQMTDAPWKIAVLLGRKVAKAALTATKYRFMGPFSIKGESPVLVTLPHPSGLCREWNDPSSLIKTRNIMQTIAPAIQWGSL